MAMAIYSKFIIAFYRFVFIYGQKTD